MSAPRPPRTSRWLLERLLPSRDREFALGDLDEEFADRNDAGRRAARAWYRRQARRAILHLLARRVPAAHGAPPRSQRRLRAWFEGTARDLAYATRSLRATPTVTLVAVLTLALGIGITAAMYTLLDTVVIRPLPLRDPDRLAVLRHVFLDGRPGEWNASFPDYLDYEAGVDALEALAAWQGATPVLTMGEGDVAIRVNAIGATANLLPMLGVAPELGRGFTAQEDRPDAGQPVALVSHALWRGRLGSDPDVLGGTIRLDGVTHAIIGVLPRGFTGAVGGGVLPLAPTDVWLPYRNSFAAEGMHLRGLANVDGVIGRLGDGQTLATANDQVAAVAAEIASQFPEDRTGETGRLVPAHDNVVGPARQVLVILFGAVSFVLLIACTNVANLQLGKATGRAREIALRMALGARRGRLVRQLLLESLVLALVGGLAGCAIAWLGVEIMERSRLLSLLPRAGTLQLDLRILAFLAVTSMGTGLVFGVVPAMQATRRDVAEALKVDERTGVGRGGHRLRHALALAEVALAVVLLVGAGLLLRSFQEALRVDPGYRTEGILTARLQTQLQFVDPDWRSSVAFFDEVIRHASTLPGVEAVAAAYQLPVEEGWSNAFEIEGIPEPPPEEDSTYAIFRPVTHGYFELLGVPLLRGRTFTPADNADAPRVAVVNQAFVRRFFPDGEDPLGKRLIYGNWWAQGPPEYEIVGVVADVRFAGRTEATSPATYFPYPQQPVREMSLLLRTNGDPLTLAAGLREAVAAVDPAMPVDRVSPLEALLADSEIPRRSSALFLGVFATTALALAAIGVYAVMGYVVSQRSREMGLRLAVGARPGDVRALVLRQGLLITGLGAGLGLLGAAALSGLLEGMLFGVDPLDPMTFGGVVLFLGTVAMIACWVPAHRATRVDPMISLRTE